MFMAVIWVKYYNNIRWKTGTFKPFTVFSVHPTKACYVFSKLMDEDLEKNLTIAYVHKKLAGFYKNWHSIILRTKDTISVILGYRR
jgi:hypothetical protein